MRALAPLVSSCLLVAIVSACAGKSDGGRPSEGDTAQLALTGPTAHSTGRSTGRTWTNGTIDRPPRGPAYATADAGESVIKVLWTTMLTSGTYAAAMTNGHVVVSGPGGTTELDAAGIEVRQAPWGGRVAVDRANDVFVATAGNTLTKYDRCWSSVWTATRSEPFVAVAADRAGEAIVVGSSGATTRFDFAGNERWTSSVPGAVSAAMDDVGDVFVLANEGGVVVVEELSDAGELQWAKRYAGDGEQVGSYIVADGEGDVIFTGLWHGTIDFGGGPMSFPGCCEGQGREGFLVGLDVSGGFLYETPHDRYYIGGLTIDPRGNAAVGGEFSDSPRSPEFSVFDRSGHRAWGGASYGQMLGTLTSLAADAEGAVVEVISTATGSQVTKLAY